MVTTMQRSAGFVLGLAPLVGLFLVGCGSSSGGNGGPGDAGHDTGTGHPGEGGTTDSGPGDGEGGSSGEAGACAPSSPLTDAPTASNIKHVIVIVQENHSFDNYFSYYCTAATDSKPTCNTGPACCETGPAMDPGTGDAPVTQDDMANGNYDPNHAQACELAEMDDGKMDGYVTGAGSCSDPRNFAVATPAVVAPYHALAAQYAIADRYFQPIAGQSSSNDMYLAVAKEVFIDNTYEPKATGAACSTNTNDITYMGQTTIADLLEAAGKTVAWYGEGYAKMQAAGTGCPEAAFGCPFKLPVYPCIYDPSDVPFAYYAQLAADPTFIRDYTELATDLAAGTLPDVSYVKGYGYHTEHPGYSDTISAGVTFVSGVLQAIEASCYANDTLVLLTWDEGGGFFDHVAPPAASTVDMQPYGTRVPLLALGHYAAKGVVSHVPMEHSSIVKFLEWNYLGGTTGQLMARDAVVNNIGSLLDPAQTGETIPDQ
jgi:phospholipase C